MQTHHVIKEMETGLYIHVPYCRQKCLYCDFYSGGSRIADWNLFSDSIIRELTQRKRELNRPPTTLYLGGGTPSLIPVSYFSKIVGSISANYEISNLYEFTIEVNPEDVNDDICSAWKDNGVNRISLGVQTMLDSELKSIGRRHDRHTIIKAYECLRRYFSNISIDLMFGLPGQTLKTYEQSLLEIISLQPTHLSSYSLMLEEGTAMTLLVNAGKIKTSGEEEWIAMFEATSNMLHEAGYRRYEVSNFALPGYESIHNTAYWKGSPYLGLGPAAHSYDGNNIRRMNPSDIKAYLRHFSTNETPQTFYIEEVLSVNELREEMIMTRLRLSEGLNINEFKMRFGDLALRDLLTKTERLKRNKLLDINSEYIRISEKGIALGNDIMASLF